MRLGPVVLRTRDANRLARFYEDALGFDYHADGEKVEVTSEGETLLVLLDDPDAVERPPRTPGLYHVAFLVPSRDALADAVERLRSETRLTGASDHLVSEAVYARDADGNGIEVYADRPRDEWEETENGVRIATLPLDIEALVADGDASAVRPASVGHVHLEVTDLDDSEMFYRELGFERRARDERIRFLGAEGYHHHVAVNTWSSPNRPRPKRAEGIVRFGVEDADESEDPDGIRVFDASDQTVY